MKNTKGSKIWMAALFVALTACEKKERLSGNEAGFFITPPAATVLRNAPITLAANTRGSSGITPVWEVTPTTAGTFNPAVGQTVVFTPTILGDATVLATYDGVQASAQLAVVSFIPTANTFNVYVDAGLPAGSDVASDIFVTGLTVTESESGYTTEGEKYLHASGVQGNSLSITLDKNSANLSKNLSEFSFGTLKFSIRLGRVMTLGEQLRVEINDTTGGPASGGGVDSGTVDFINEVSTDWQEVSIPISTLAPTQNLTAISVPFALVLLNLGAPLTFDVDAIRWEK